MPSSLFDCISYMQVICVDEKIMPVVPLLYLMWQSYQSEAMEE